MVEGDKYSCPSMEPERLLRETDLVPRLEEYLRITRSGAGPDLDDRYMAVQGVLRLFMENRSKHAAHIEAKRKQTEEEGTSGIPPYKPEDFIRIRKSLY